MIYTPTLGTLLHVLSTFSHPVLLPEHYPICPMNNNIVAEEFREILN